MHDIGKNIVGVVLACNNFDVIDLGVMVPMQTIIDTAHKEQVDIVGLSGLITPSLREMTKVAQGLHQQSSSLPLLIGGATTSRVHTALKIEPEYCTAPTIWVKDASRAVGVAQKILSNKAEEYIEEIKTDYAMVRNQHANKSKPKNLLSIKQARENAARLNWDEQKTLKPKHTGVKVLDNIDLASLLDVIDWQPFFASWEMNGKFPDLLNDPIKGKPARALFEDAKAMLKIIIDEKWLTAKAVIGIYPAKRDIDDVHIYTDEIRQDRLGTLCFLRQQNAKRNTSPNQCLADFITDDEQISDWVGMFAVTTGHGIETHVKRFEEANDDYNAILLKALADRLAEALAEWLHREIRTRYWGYVSDEQLDTAQLTREEYQGIRPAPGYPACPDHTEKLKIFKYLDVEKNIGVNLTESMAMYPTAAVSGYYFSHPESRYFVVGQIGKDQLADYAKRKTWSSDEAEQWLANNL